MATHEQGFLTKLPAELQTQILQYASSSVHRLRRSVAGRNIGSNAASLLATSKQIYNTGASILHQSDSFVLTPYELRTFSDSTGFCQIKNLTIIDDVRSKQGRCVQNLLKFILACVDRHTRRAGLKQSSLQSLTIRSASFQSVDTAPSNRFKVTAQDLGIWSVQCGRHFQVSLVQPLLANVGSKWKAQSQSTTMADVTGQIYSQQKRYGGDVNKLLELYLLRATMALQVWIQQQRSPRASKECGWYEMAAMSFIEPYLPNSKQSIRGMRGNDVVAAPKTEQGLTDVMNSVLLQIVSPD